MNYYILAFLGIFSLSSLSAQEYKNFKLSDSLDFDLTDAKKAEDESVLMQTYSVEYVLGGGSISQFNFIHEARWINSDEAIESNNKIYLASRESTEYLFQYARVIKPNGEIVNLKEDDIQEGVYDNDVKYYYYALEGLEKGSIIETATYQQKSPYYYGSIVYLQEDIVRYNTMFELICPPHLVFDFKSINGAPEVEVDTVIDDVNRWFIKQDSTVKILDQSNVYKKAIRQSVIYKLDRNNYSNVGDITSYGVVSQNIFTNLHPDLSKGTLKKIKTLLKATGAANLSTEEDKIRAIENYLKTNFQIMDSDYPQLKEVDFILSNKAMNSTGSIVLFINMLDMLEIKHELVYTCERDELKFDPDFEAYLFLDKKMIYFPKIKKYLDPSNGFNRLGLVPSMLTNNYGLFIKEVSLGEMSAAIGKVKFIEPTSYKENADNMEVNVDFSNDALAPEVSVKKELSGYSAMYIQPYIHLMDDEALSNMRESLAEMVSESIKPDTVLMSNVDENDLGVKPFVFEFSSNEHAFIEKAGNDILFKIGDVIGPQAEMYQEEDEERQFDVEDDHQRSYYRKITFNVPEGYTIKNPEILNISIKFGEPGNENIFFESKLTKKGESYEVECYEYYADITYPKEDFENYRSVVNAAADFNKLVLIFEKH